jgi:phytoene dehydrogenase-like protein
VLAVSRDLEKTVENIGRYSKKDAQTWRTLVEHYRVAKDEIVASLFSPGCSEPCCKTLEITW